MTPKLTAFERNPLTHCDATEEYPDMLRWGTKQGKPSELDPEAGNGQKIRSFLLAYLKVYLHGIPQTAAIDALGFRVLEDIFEGRANRFSTVQLLLIMKRLGIDRKDVLESARFHSGS
jgi:hypothetical protein